MRPTGSRAATLWKSAARPRASFGTIRELPLRVSSNDDADEALVIAYACAEAALYIPSPNATNPIQNLTAEACPRPSDFRLRLNG